MEVVFLHPSPIVSIYSGLLGKACSDCISGGAAFILIAWTLHLKEQKSHILYKLARVDWVGATLFVISSTAFLVSVSWGGIQYVWISAATLVPLIGGLIGLGLFVVWEIYCPVAPLVPLSIFTTRTAAVGYLQIIIAGTELWVLVYYLPLYFEVVKGYSAISTSIALFPQTLLAAPVAVVIGITIGKIGRYKKLLVSGWAISVLGCGVMILLRSSSTIPQWIFIDMLSGVGMGFLLPSMQFSVQAAARDEDMAFAAGMVATMRTVGQAIGLPVFGAIFQSVLRTHLEHSPLKEQASVLSRDVFQAAVSLRTMNPEDVPVLRYGFELAARACFIGLVPTAALGLLASLFSEDLSLDRVLYTEHGVGHNMAGPDDEEQ